MYASCRPRFSTAAEPPHELVDHATGAVVRGWVVCDASDTARYLQEAGAGGRCHQIHGGNTLRAIGAIPLEPEAKGPEDGFTDIHSDCVDLIVSAAMLQSLTMMVDHHAKERARAPMVDTIRRLRDLAGLFLEQARGLADTTDFRPEARSQ